MNERKIRASNVKIVSKWIKADKREEVGGVRARVGRDIWEVLRRFVLKHTN